MAMIPSFLGNQSSSSIFDPFSVDVWDPFRNFYVSSLSLVSLEKLLHLLTRAWTWRETPEAQVFKADLQGVEKAEVKVEIEDDRVLQISGERNVEKEEKNDKWHRVDRGSGMFSRRFRSPENVKMAEINACVENGVHIPKEGAKEPDVKAVEISV